MLDQTLESSREANDATAGVTSAALSCASVWTARLVMSQSRRPPLARMQAPNCDLMVGDMPIRPHTAELAETLSNEHPRQVKGTCMSESPKVTLKPASERALQVRALYEILEQRLNGKVWTLHELMIGFSNDVGYIGRLLLANDGTWDIAGDPKSELEHKLAESLWWIFVIADRLDVDITAAFNQTMDHLYQGLQDEGNLQAE